ncbi:hypothetical protein CMU19_04360 [Elizabethkingia anophelis]|nr:hypothetical protein [Elizabethkingia anophelis]
MPFDEDDVLIKLHRQFGKDELVALMKKKLSEAQVEIGKLNSEIDELKDSEAKETRLTLAREKSKKSEEQRVVQMKKNYKNISNRLLTAKNDVYKLISENASLKREVEELKSKYER